MMAILQNNQAGQHMDQDEEAHTIRRLQEEEFLDDQTVFRERGGTGSLGEKDLKKNASSRSDLREATHITLTKKRNSKTEAGVTLVPGFVIISNEGASLETQNTVEGGASTAPHYPQEQHLKLPMSSQGGENATLKLSLKESGRARPNALSSLLGRVGEVEKWQGEASPDRFSNDLIHTVVTEQQKSARYLNRSREPSSPAQNASNDPVKTPNGAADIAEKIQI